MNRVLACLSVIALAGACADAGPEGSDQGSPHVPDQGSVHVPAIERAQPLRIERIERIDVLFVVDDSGSMREEQAALQAQLPAMARTLLGGDVDGDGRADFPPPDALRLGVVSTDMGVPGVEGIPACSGLGGDGVLRGDDGRCGEGAPPFVTFAAGDPVDDAADAFACMAQLGTEGCGFEQQLEAGLKALWPQHDDRVLFHDITGDDATKEGGHGGGANGEFSQLQSDATPSLVVVVLVTDEDDCSAANLRIFTPDLYLDPEDPLADQDLNMRCFLNDDQLYPIERYVAGLRGLREGAEQLVLLAAIVGVPPALVDEEAMAAVDLGDESEREAFYQGLLDDERMQAVEDETRSEDEGSALKPSCEGDNGSAFPPRRIVQTVRAFGDNGMVQSICQDDFRPAMGQILERIAARMRDPMAAP